MGLRDGAMVLHYIITQPSKPTHVINALELLMVIVTILGMCLVREQLLGFERTLDGLSCPLQDRVWIGQQPVKPLPVITMLVHSTCGVDLTLQEFTLLDGNVDYTVRSRVISGDHPEAVQGLLDPGVRHKVRVHRIHISLELRGMHRWAKHALNGSLALIRSCILKRNLHGMLLGRLKVQFNVGGGSVDHDGYGTVMTAW
jgi:hypothetical protein